MSALPDDSPDTPAMPVPKPTRAQAFGLLLLSIAGRLTLALLASFAAMSAFIHIAHEVSEGDTLRSDRAILGFFAAHQFPVFHAVMTAISWLAGPKFQTAVVVLGFLGFLIARRFWPDGFALLVAGVGGLGVIVGLKHLFHRPRPSEVFAHLGYSFPSGHSFFALTVYGMFAYWLARDAPPQPEASDLEHRRRGDLSGRIQPGGFGRALSVGRAGRFRHRRAVAVGLSGAAGGVPSRRARPDPRGASSADPEPIGAVVQRGGILQRPYAPNAPLRKL